MDRARFDGVFWQPHISSPSSFPTLCVPPRLQTVRGRGNLNVELADCCEAAWCQNMERGRLRLPLVIRSVLLLALFFECRQCLVSETIDRVNSSFFASIPRSFSCAHTELVYGVQVKIFGEFTPLPPDQPILVIMNHRTRFDWMFMWSFFLRCGSLSKHKIIMKNALKHIPGVGWCYPKKKGGACVWEKEIVSLEGDPRFCKQAVKMITATPPQIWCTVPANMNGLPL